MIYTSYFAKVNKLPENARCISICLSPPKGYNGLEYKALAPTWDILKKYKMNMDQDEYAAAFRAMLSRLNPREVLKDFYSMLNYEDRDMILLCYEKPPDFCHRHLVAEWFTNNGYPVEEYQF